MNRLKGIKNIADLKELLLLHKESIKKAVLPLMVVTALLFFWVNGGRNTDNVEEVDEQTSDIVVEDYNGEIKQTEEQGDVDIYVDIGGCVYNPGVYKVKAGTRLFQVIDKAGGLTSDADINSINQAEEVYDGQKILIYSNATDEEMSSIFQSNQNESNGKININKADSTQLQEIPGVGPATAQKIIEHRETNGRFQSIDDIKNVNGIGEKTFQNLKDYITV